MSQKGFQDRVLTHSKFGEMIYDYDGWHPVSATAGKAPLWGQVFKVEMSFMAKDRGQEINSLQEEAYNKFERLITEHNDAIEQKILSQFKVSEEKAAAAYIPVKLYFGRRGECMLEFRDTEMSEEEYADDVLLGFTLLMLPKLSICCDYDALCYMQRCWENTNVFEYGRDPIQEILEEDDMAINVEGITDEERKARRERFQARYGQALVKFDEESIKETREVQEDIDSIEMPKAPIVGTIVGMTILGSLWAGSICLNVYAKKVFPYLLFHFLLFAITIGGISLCRDEWSDYRLAKRDLRAYKLKMWGKKKKANSEE